VVLGIEVEDYLVTSGSSLEIFECKNHSHQDIDWYSQLLPVNKGVVHQHLLGHHERLQKLRARAPGSNKVKRTSQTTTAGSKKSVQQRTKERRVLDNRKVMLGFYIRRVA
jgi:hypothetical protein